MIIVLVLVVGLLAVGVGVIIGVCRSVASAVSSRRRPKAQHVTYRAPDGRTFVSRGKVRR